MSYKAEDFKKRILELESQKQYIETHLLETQREAINQLSKYQLGDQLRVEWPNPQAPSEIIEITEVSFGWLTPDDDWSEVEMDIIYGADVITKKGRRQRMLSISQSKLLNSKTKLQLIRSSKE